MLPLDCEQEFDPAREEEFFTALPARPAVFLVEPWHKGAQPYLLRTADLKRRLERLLRAPDALSKRLNLREFAARIRYRLTGSAFEQSLVHYQHTRALFPRRYRHLTRLRPPALLKVNLANAYPRCYVTRRIVANPAKGQIAGGGLYFGPFATRRAAEAFANEFLDLFKIRRCQIKIRRDPSFPGCMYSEMKMCLAPCFAGCSKEEYDAEVGRVVSFLASSGAALTGELERKREAASAALDFERAAPLHRKLEKAAEVLCKLPELARHVDDLHPVIVKRWLSILRCSHAGSTRSRARAKYSLRKALRVSHTRRRLFPETPMTRPVCRPPTRQKIRGDATGRTGASSVPARACSRRQRNRKQKIENRKG